MHSRQILCKNLSLIWRLLFPISIVLSRLNSKTLTFSFYTMLSKILNIAVLPLILLFLFNWLWDLLSKFECKYSSWALTTEGLLSVSYRRSCCQNSEDHGCSLYLTATDTQYSLHCLPADQQYVIFAVSVICLSWNVCWQISIGSCFRSRGLGSWAFIPKTETCAFKEL